MNERLAAMGRRGFPEHQEQGCSSRFFDRRGGSSEGVFASLNVGDGLGDSADAVKANRELVKDSLQTPYLLSAKQTHGTGIYHLTSPLSADLVVEGYDALITYISGVSLMIQQADCQGVLLYDPKRKVIAAVHCGWRGSVQGILPKAVSSMVENYGSVPAQLLAAISPSLGPCCAEFINYRRELPLEFQKFMVRDNHFDFWQISREQLLQCGILPHHVEVAGICTCCSDDYFSYRRSSRLGDGVTGRHCSVIALPAAATIPG